MSLRRYLAERIMVAMCILWVIASLNFLMFEVISSVKPQNMYISLKWTAEMKKAPVELWGLNKPMYIRYLKYVQNMFTWNFGYSLHTMGPVAVDMSFRLPTTVLLLGSALVATVLIGITAGIFAASKRGSKVDVSTIGGGIFMWAIPLFYIQLLFPLSFCYYT